MDGLAERKLYSTCSETVTALFNELVAVASVFGVGRNWKHPASVSMQPAPQIAVGPQTNVGFETSGRVDHRAVDISGRLIKLLSSVCKFYLNYITTITNRQL